MRVVRDAEGTELLLVTESAESCLVRDPATGRETHRPREDLEVVDGVSPLEAAAGAVPDAYLKLITAVPSSRGLGLLVTVASRGPISARELQETTEVCESDLHGLLASFVAAGCLEETTVGSERGYRIGPDVERALSDLVSEPTAE